MKALIFCLTMAAVVASTAGPLAAQGTFTGLGSRDSYVSGMSADGSIVVGVRGNDGPAFRWTADGGAVDIGSVSQQTKISRDGKVIVGSAQDAKGITSAAIWQGGTQWRTLGGTPNGRVQDNTLSSAWGVSADGSVIVGLAWVKPTGGHGFRWDAVNGMVDLGSFQNKSSRASAVSGDGHVAVGWNENSTWDGALYSWIGSMWWQGMQRFLNPFGWIGQGEGVNDSGSVIVGRGHPSFPRHAYRFTAWDGAVIELGAIPRGFTPNVQDQEDQSIAFGVSDDGTVVVGSSGWKPPTDAFIWTPDTKMVKLKDYLKDKGVSGIEGWTLLVANSVSPDGKIIAGTGINEVKQEVEGWIVKLQ